MVFDKYCYPKYLTLNVDILYFFTNVAFGFFLLEACTHHTGVLVEARIDIFKGGPFFIQMCVIGPKSKYKCLFFTKGEIGQTPRLRSLRCTF